MEKTNHATHRKPVYDDPIIDFYATVLKYDANELPDVFPEENKRELLSILDSLPENRRVALIAYYGLDGRPPMNCREIAESLDPPKSTTRIRELVRDAEKKLRCSWRCDALRNLLYTKATCLEKIEATEERQKKLTAEIAGNPKVEELLTCLEKARALIDDLRWDASVNAYRSNTEKIKSYSEVLDYLNRCGINSSVYSATSFTIIDRLNDEADNLYDFVKHLKTGEITKIKAELVDTGKVNYNMSVYGLDLSHSAGYALYRARIKTIGQLAQIPKHELIRIHGIKQKTADYIARRCAEIGIILPE